MIDYDYIVKHRKPRSPDRIKPLDPLQEKITRLLFEKIRWPHGPVCPCCGHRKSYTMRKRVGYYKCASCRSQYTVRVGTVMHGTHLSYIDWWKTIEQFCISEKGYPGKQTERYIDCTYKTAWYFSGAGNGVSSVGQTATTASTAINVPAVNQLNLSGSIGQSNILNGRIKKFAYYPLPLTNTQIQSLSAN